MKELLEDIKLNKIDHLLNKIKKGNLNDKIKYFNKLKKYKITKRIGLFLIKNSTQNYNADDELGGINSSIIELCFKEYYDEYTEEIRNIFENLNDNAKDRVLYLLTTINDEKVLELYSELVLKYYTNRNMPIGDLANKPTLYSYLFPKLYQALKFKFENNNIIVLINSYLNSGIISEEDLKKNKKILTDNICNIFKKALTYKSNDTYSSLNNIEYKALRYYLELAINIERYISSKRTIGYLEKLLKKHDNQIKLFILDNYIRNGKNIKDFNYNEIAKDNASRYALFELLTIYEKKEYMPSKYLNQELIAESDLFTNFVISSSYTSKPEDIEFYKKVTLDNYDYYVYKFKFRYNYNTNFNEYLTDYIINQIGINRHNGEEIVSDFIGISGGYDSNSELSLISNNLNRLLIDKIDENSNIDDVVDKLINYKNEIIPVINEEKTTKKKKEKKEKIKKEKTQKIKVKKIKIKKEKNKITDSTLQNELLLNKEEKQGRIGFYIIIFLCFIFIGLFVYCTLYIYGIASINDQITEQTIRTSKIDTKYEFEEINATDIFNKDGEYYVLLYIKPKDEKYKYYFYINEYLKRDIKVYYVDLSKDENKILYKSNDLKFTLYSDRFLKVNDHEYVYYVDGDNHIINNMEEEIEQIKIEEKKQKEAEKKKEESKEK